MINFVDHARETLARREKDGVRGVSHEWNRFSTHIEGAGFAQKKIDAVTSVDLRDWIREMQAKPAQHRKGETLADETTKRVWSLVCAIFVDAVERDVIKVPPHIGVKVRKRADARATREKWTYLTLDEQKAVASCEAIPYRARLIIRFAIGTGLRQAELYHLRLGDLVLGHDKPCVVVRYGRDNLPPKSGKIRTVPLFGDALVAAKRWSFEIGAPCRANPMGLVFPREDGTVRACGKPFAGDKTFQKYLARAGITRRVRWHDLRHTFCSNLVTGVLGKIWPLIMVRDAAGHSSVTITEKYAHCGQRDLVSLGAECTFAHDAMPIAAAAPPADDFYAFDWDEAVAS